MRSTSDVRRVFELHDLDCSKSEIARQTGVSRSQVRGWLAVGLDAVMRSPMRELPRRMVARAVPFVVRPRVAS
jgi:DNA-directed RNA polymerase specialized sigma24 family protein